MISVKNLKKTYFLGGEEVHALDDVSLSIKEHEFVAIIGQSGSGKSTFMNMLGCLDRPDSGEITLDGTDEEYENEPHIINEDGDYMFTDGKWKGMVFHPYNEHEVKELDSQGATFMTEKIGDGMRVKIIKRKD